MRYGGQNTGTVTCVVVASTGASMGHASEHGASVCDDLVGGNALDADNETDATGIFLETGIIQADFVWQTDFVQLHLTSSSSSTINISRAITLAID